MKEHSEPSKEETKLQSEQKTLQEILLSRDIVFESLPNRQLIVYNELAFEDLRDAIEEYASQFKSQLPIEQKDEEIVALKQELRRVIHEKDKEISTLKSQPLPIEQKNELELIIAEKNIDIIHLRDRIKELESQPLPIEGVEREQLREAFEAGQHADDYDQWVKHNYDFDEWLATRKGSKPDNF